MRVIHPETEDQIAARDRLLQTALREGDPGYGIAAEYPLVLAPAARATSFVVVDGARVVAHANLWPRTAMDETGAAAFELGLVGNVATDPECRGLGLMHRLFEELRKKARERSLRALVLWSDLQEFYQKLGFRSCGAERRYLYDARLARAVPLAAPSELPAPPPAATLERWLAARPKTALTLRRSPAEMAAQLTIPETHVYELARGAGHLVCGRGQDLRGVVHEWSATTPAALLAGLAGLLAADERPHLMLLAPADLPSAWDDALRRHAVLVEDHPMALATWIDAPATTKEADLLDRLFVWGLDSI